MSSRFEDTNMTEEQQDNEREIEATESETEERLAPQTAEP